MEQRNKEPQINQHIYSSTKEARIYKVKKTVSPASGVGKLDTFISINEVRTHTHLS